MAFPSLGGPEDPSKIPPGRVPGAPRIDPRSLPEHPRVMKIRRFAQSWPQKGKRGRQKRTSRALVGPSGSFWPHFGVRPGLKIDPKLTQRLPGHSHRRSQMPLWPHFCVSRNASPIFSIFDHFRSKIHANSKAVFSQCHAFFQPCDPHETLFFTVYEACFQFSTF